MTSDASSPVMRRTVELGLLLALAFFLPLFEAPKNILWLAYVVTWAWNRWRDGSWGGAWDRWDTLAGAWIASAYVVAAFAGTDGDEWMGANDVLRYGLAFWCVKRSGYSAREFAWLAGALLTGCAVGLAWGFWRYYVSGERTFIELHSVGHVNHSAPYLAICIGLTLSWLLARWHAWGASRRALMAVLLAFLVAGAIAGESRGAVGALLAVPPVLGAAWRPRSRRLLPMLAAVSLTVVAAGIVADVGVVAKQRAGVEAGDHLSHRETIWRRAFVGWQVYPWFGAGIDNYKKITDEALRAKVEADGGRFKPEDYVGANHAHNLYLNTLAERGVFGSAVFGAVLVAWAASLWRRRPAAADGDAEWAFWGAAVGAWTVIVLAGLFNTSFHHEIALLAMLLLGGWLSLNGARR